MITTFARNTQNSAVIITNGVDSPKTYPLNSVFFAPVTRDGLSLAIYLNNDTVRGFPIWQGKYSDMLAPTQPTNYSDAENLLGALFFLTNSSNATLPIIDRKSTRLNSSHANISYAVFCL